MLLKPSSPGDDGMRPAQAMRVSHADQVVFVCPMFDVHSRQHPLQALGVGLGMRGDSKQSTWERCMMHITPPSAEMLSRGVKLTPSCFSTHALPLNILKAAVV